MKKVLSTALAGVLAAATLMPVAPAVAQDRDWCKYGNCDRDGDDEHDGDWSSRRDRDRDRDWDRDDWKRYSYKRHRDRDWDRGDWRWRHRHDDFDGRDAAGLVFGLAAGAIAGSIAGQGYYGGSYERCAAAYRSFDPATWTYLGYDGYRHRCPY